MSPKQQERRFDPSYAKTLLEIAYGDFRTAVFAAQGIENQNVRIENVFFMHQQAIEKALKAVLCHLEIPVPLVHDLGALLAKLPEGSQPDAGYELTTFNDFAGVRRYEEGTMIYEEEDIDDARILTGNLLAWASGIVGKS
jgi:HEPN domain-containing protein